MAIIGSANINDRSMLGSRDSEMAAIVSGGAEVTACMDGNPRTASRFAHSMRLQLWRQALGLMEVEGGGGGIVDPVCDATYHDVWMATALANTEFYERRYPKVGQLTQVAAGVAAAGGAPLRPRRNKVVAGGKSLLGEEGRDEESRAALLGEEVGTTKELEEPRGLLVLYSLAFKLGKTLKPDALSPEGLAPAKVFQ